MAAEEGPKTAMAECVLRLSCEYGGVLLAVMLAMLLACVAVWTFERFQRSRFSARPGGADLVSTGSGDTWLRTSFSSRMRPPPAPEHGQGELGWPSRDSHGVLEIGMEICVVAADEARGWCGRLGGVGGTRQAWFSQADSSSELEVALGDVLTVVGLKQESWSGACRGATANFTLPEASIAVAPPPATSSPGWPGSQSANRM